MTYLEVIHRGGERRSEQRHDHSKRRLSGGAGHEGREGCDAEGHLVDRRFGGSVCVRAPVEGGTAIVEVGVDSRGR